MRLIELKKKFFNKNKFINKNVRTKFIKQGDINYLQKRDISEALGADLYIIFGASYIKGWLVNYLIKKKGNKYSYGFISVLQRFFLQFLGNI